MSVEGQIRRSSRRYGVDPRAAEAVARQEGGLRRGAVGDQGTSYGPFQLHEGGALPRGRGAAWANSPAGIDYAVRQMAASGARGKRGRLAIEAIVRGFERPANPGREIARASAAYGSVAPLSASTVPTAGVGPLPTMGGTVARPNLAAALQKYAASGGSSLAPILAAGVPAKAAPKLTAYGPTDPHGTLRAPPATGGVVDRVLAAAHAQIGKPYQFGSGPSTSSFDCSDLIQYAYAQVGVHLPRTTFQQVNVGKAVRGPLRPGDLIFPSPHHVVMYVGGGKVIAAPHTGTVVQYQPAGYFTKHPYAVRRVL